MAFQSTAKVPGPAVPDFFFDKPGAWRTSMTAENNISRRAMLMKLGLFLNGIVGVFLAVPIVRYLLSPVVREKEIGYESWLSLGGLQQFPPRQTPLPPNQKPL